MEKRMISIWFFIGLILTLYGLLILGAGLYDLIHPAKLPVVLASLHSSVWWGALLVALGLVYIVKFRPKKTAE
jgi:FtsH-binding integral membrane protein